MGVEMAELEASRGLYAAAGEFYELAPWNWMLDKDIFGVKDPHGNEIGYCAVLGRRGEVYGLVVYLGSAGLKLHGEIQSGELVDPEEIFYIQHCLTAFFGGRDKLENRDLAMVKALGLKYRADSWPEFRSLHPGFMPWFLTPPEIVFLKEILMQAIDVCSHFRQNPKVLTPPREGLQLVRVRGEDGLWRDEYLAPEPLKEVALEPVEIDEVRLARLAAMGKKRQGIWETDLFFTSISVKGKERPYFPRMSAWVDNESGLVLACDLLAPEEKHGTALVQRFMKLAEGAEVLPRVLAVKRREVEEPLLETARRLGVAVRRDEELPMLEEFKAEIRKKFE